MASLSSYYKMIISLYAWGSGWEPHWQGASVMKMESPELRKYTDINCRKTLDLPAITPFLFLPWQHIGSHGNRYLRFLLRSIMDVPSTFFPNQWNIWEFRTFFHHHSNRYQGNRTLVFFLLLGSHGPWSRSVQNWEKNNVPHEMFPNNMYMMIIIC